MKRNFLAVITAALMATSALADTANVNVYGKLDVTINSANGTGSEVSVTPYDFPARWRLICNSCYLGFKGSEDLADGLKANWQIESGVQVSSATTSVWQIRNSAIGIEGSWGSFNLGMWDTPYKKLGEEFEPTFGSTPGYMVALMDTPGLNATSTTFSAIGATATDVSFSRRQVGSLWYVSPKFYNTMITLFYSGNGAKYPAVTASTVAGNPNMLSTVAKFDNDMFFAGFGYESHGNARATATFGALTAPTDGTSDTGLKLVAGVRPIEGLMVGGGWASLKYRNKLAAGEDTYSKSAFIFATSYTMDKWKFAGAFASAGDGSCTLASAAACTATDTGATHLAFSVAHNYTKRTSAYVFYSAINNKLNATYNWAMSSDQVTAVTAGQGTNLGAFGLGMRHTF